MGGVAVWNSGQGRPEWSCAHEQKPEGEEARHVGIREKRLLDRRKSMREGPEVGMRLESWEMARIPVRLENEWGGEVMAGTGQVQPLEALWLLWTCNGFCPSEKGQEIYSVFCGPIMCLLPRKSERPRAWSILLHQWISTWMAPHPVPGTQLALRY